MIGTLGGLRTFLLFKVGQVWLTDNEVATVLTRIDSIGGIGRNA